MSDLPPASQIAPAYIDSDDEDLPATPATKTTTATATAPAPKPAPAKTEPTPATAPPAEKATPAPAAVKETAAPKKTGPISGPEAMELEKQLQSGTMSREQMDELFRRMAVSEAKQSMFGDSPIADAIAECDRARARMEAAQKAEASVMEAGMNGGKFISPQDRYRLKYAATEAGMKAYGLDEAEIAQQLGNLESVDTDGAEMSRAMNEFSQQED